MGCSRSLSAELKSLWAFRCLLCDELHLRETDLLSELVRGLYRQVAVMHLENQLCHEIDIWLRVTRALLFFPTAGTW